MTPEKWERINALFESACDLPPAERSAFLSRESEDDPSIADEVNRLIENHINEGFLDRTVPDIHDMIRASTPDAPHMFNPGDVLAGRFAVQKFLGRGGMGEVYSAYDKELREVVAVKTIRSDIANDESVIDKFRAEVQRARRIVHPNTCRVYDIFSTERNGKMVRFLTMELLEGETLDLMLRHRGKVPPNEALDLVQQMADGLNAVHETGLVHRDFKPANVFLVPRPDGRTRVVVTDFGLARRSATTTRTGDTSRSFAPGAGTPAYMAPEQFLGADVTPRTDVYALGLVAYEMVAGIKPFPAESATRRLVEAPPPPVVHVRDLPTTWNNTIVACLERDPKLRPATALDVIRQIRIEQTPAVPVPHPARRWTWVAAAVAVLVLGGIIWGVTRAPGGFAHSETEVFPTLSPDGTRLVFADGPAEGRDLILQQLPSGERLNLTADNPLEDSEPAFSPNGSAIAFYSVRRVEGNSLRRGLHLLDISSRKVIFLAPDGHSPTWSPDGTRIAFVQEPLDEAANRTLHQSKLFIVNVATHAIENVKVEDALQPAWSPNGKWIAFVQIQGGFRRIHFLDLETGRSTLVTRGDSVHFSPAWSPDGKFLYYCGDAAGTMNLYRLRVEELTGMPVGEAQSMPLPGDYIGPISIAQSSNKLAYVRDFSTTTLYKVALQQSPPSLGTVERLPVTSSLMLAVELSLSPDGRRLAFSTQRAQRDIFVVDINGTHQTRLTNDRYRELDPTWSPDGTWIAFQSNRNPNPIQRRYEIQAMRADGSGRWVLTNTAGMPGSGAVYPIWHPNGQELAFTLNGSGVFRTIVRPGRTDAAPEKLLGYDSLGGEHFIARSWSPDGATIAGVVIGTDGRPAGIALLNVAGQKLTRLTSDEGLGPTWMADSRRLLYRCGRSICLADTVTGQVTALSVPGNYRPYNSLVITADGRSVIFSHLDRKTSVDTLNLDDRY